MRLRREKPEAEVAESTVRQYVRARKAAMGLLGHEIFVPQSYQFGGEAQVDWYEGWVEFDGEVRKTYVFCLRSMASGGAFHRAYPHATQQAFLEAHELAFAYFGGVFRVLRYDNLKSAVKKILRGHQREETARFIGFRSHWGFASEFCTPGEGHEKGGVECGFRRRRTLFRREAEQHSGLKANTIGAKRRWHSDCARSVRLRQEKPIRSEAEAGGR